MSMTLARMKRGFRPTVSDKVAATGLMKKEATEYMDMAMVD